MTRSIPHEVIVPVRVAPINMPDKLGISTDLAMTVMQDAVEWRGLWRWRQSLYECIELPLVFGAFNGNQ